MPIFLSAGDIINGPEPNPAARIPDPYRLVRAYNQVYIIVNLPSPTFF